MTRCPEKLVWDTDFLGYPVAQLRATTLDDIALTAVLQRCRATGVRLLYLFVDPDDAVTIAAAQQIGLPLVDHRLTFARLSPTGVIDPTNTKFQLNPTETFTPELEKLGWQSGEYSRFRRDPGFTPDVFLRLYSQWLRNCLGNPSTHRVIVAKPGAGLICGLVALARQDQYTSIELIAVDAAVRNQGVGRQLIAAAQQQATRWGQPVLRVVTQADNQPAISFYHRSGFRLASEEQVYHGWL